MGQVPRQGLDASAISGPASPARTSPAACFGAIITPVSV